MKFPAIKKYPFGQSSTNVLQGFQYAKLNSGQRSKLNFLFYGMRPYKANVYLKLLIVLLFCQLSVDDPLYNGKNEPENGYILF